MLYDQALDCGISVDAFWNYSPMEIYDMMQSHYRRQVKEIKQQIMHDFIMAEVKARYISLDKNQEKPFPWEYYPELFTEEIKMYKQQKAQEDLEKYKEARRAYIEEFNKRRQQGN